MNYEWESDMSELSFRERVLLGIIASLLTLSVFAPTCDPEVQVPNGYVERQK